LLLLVVFLDLSLTLKMEAVLVSSAETSVNIYQTTRGHIPKFSIFFHICFGFKYENISVVRLPGSKHVDEDFISCVFSGMESVRRFVNNKFIS
jgi:hypothetical protein